MKNYSRQREAVLQTLTEHPEHPTAEALYERVKKTLPNIGIATVYRNLRDLTASGMVQTVPGLFKEHFDATTEPHAHFLCECCGRVTDVMLPDRLIKELSALSEGSLQLVFRGTCADCKQET